MHSERGIFVFFGVLDFSADCFDEFWRSKRSIFRRFEYYYFIKIYNARCLNWFWEMIRLITVAGS